MPICVPYSFLQDADIASSRADKKSVTSLIYMRKVENRPGWRAPTDQKVARGASRRTAALGMKAPGGAFNANRAGRTL